MPEETEFRTANIKKKVKRIMFTIRIDDDLYALLNEYQYKNKISRSRAIRDLLRAGVKANV